MKTNKTVVGVIGCGRIAQTHIPVLARLEDVRLKYLCDLIPEKAERTLGPGGTE